MTEGMEDLCAGPTPPPGSASPTGSAVDTGQVPEEKPEEKPEEVEAAVQSGEEGAEEAAEGGAADGDGDGDGGRAGAVGVVACPGACCVCIEMGQINNCLHSEKICILPILACLLSLALCTAGLKWVFVDKIFEYEPPTHLDPIPIGQDPIIISVDPTLGITVSIPHPSPSSVSLTTTIAITPGRPEVLVEDRSTRGPPAPRPPRGTEPSVTLKYNAERPTTAKHPQTTQELDNNIPTVSTSSSSTTAKTSSHVTPCSDSQKNFCVNGGECYILKITEGNTKFLCRCPNEFTGDRCQNYVMASFYKAEELYQKRILTISGICIALLVVGIMCVVAYCKTKKQGRKLRDRLRQSVRKKRNSNTKSGAGSKPASSAAGRQISNLPLQDLQLINQCNGTATQHAAERETETTFSTSKYALSANEATTFTHVSTQRFASPVTTMTRLSGESRTSLTTPGSPPSEMSAPLSSLAVSVPSVALSPSGEEERPLLLSSARRTHGPSGRDDQKRSSAHYNHGHEAHSLPPSPRLASQTLDCPGVGDAGRTFSASPQEPLGGTNGVSDGGGRAMADHVLHYMESGAQAEEAPGDRTPFLTMESTAALLLRARDSSRTNPAAPGADLQGKPAKATIKQDPDAV
ncbi:pro-neuregulin-1, membrane-bound isoform isoform X3 [Salarias fasciatus]|uniref:pro-neuregulin-1, membrane-bound isoform isoform X3 n=1 Tax=Salarias fasciatus TaxID=181472 RepID=UPI0011765030|nr:pro-neuregulin-1, membrane-bound isoform-like isoform X3 [Salarias fasciatus]